MRRHWNDPWVHGDAADPLLALIIVLMLGAIVAGALMLFTR